MDSPCIKQTVCKVLKIFQYGKYLVAYVLKRDVINLCIGYRYCYNKKNRRHVLGLETEQIAIGTHKSRLGDFAPMSTNNLYIGEILILIKTHLVSSSLDPNLA